MATKKKSTATKGKKSTGRPRGRPSKSTKMTDAKKSVGRPRGRPSHSAIALEKFIEMQAEIMKVLPIMKEGLEFELRRNKELDEVFASMKEIVPSMMKTLSAMTDQAKPFSVIDGGAVEAEPGKIIPIKRPDLEEASLVDGSEIEQQNSSAQSGSKILVADRSGESVPVIPA